MPIVPARRVRIVRAPCRPQEAGTGAGKRKETSAGPTHIVHGRKARQITRCCAAARFRQAGVGETAKEARRSHKDQESVAFGEK